jgi:cation diffusion facilitator family transporter
MLSPDEQAEPRDRPAGRPAGLLLRRNTAIAMAVGVGLAGVKITGGVVGNSSALVADGIESLADALGSVIVWKALLVADRPPDRDHPYGYGRAEAVAALTVGVLLVVAALLIIIKAIGDILTPHRAPAPWTIGLLVGVVLVKEGMFRLVLKGAREFASEAARADAWHHRADAITSTAAVVGVSIAIWGPGLFGIDLLILADEAAALLASGVIVHTGISLMRPSLREVLDATSHEIAERVAMTASKVEGVRLVEKIHARKSGRGYLVDMHLHVEPEMDVRTAHALAGKVKAVIQAAHPVVVHVLVHIEPAET